MADTWHVPRDWTAGEVVSETMMDEDVRDNMTYLKYRALEFAISNRSFTYLSKTVPVSIDDVMKGG